MHWANTLASCFTHKALQKYEVKVPLYSPSPPSLEALPPSPTFCWLSRAASSRCSTSRTPAGWQRTWPGLPPSPLGSPLPCQDGGPVHKIMNAPLWTRSLKFTFDSSLYFAFISSWETPLARPSSRRAFFSPNGSRLSTSWLQVLQKPLVSICCQRSFSVLPNSWKAGRYNSVLNNFNGYHWVNLYCRRFQKVPECIAQLDFVSVTYNLCIVVKVRAPPDVTLVSILMYWSMFWLRCLARRDFKEAKLTWIGRALRRVKGWQFWTRLVLSSCSDLFSTPAWRHTLLWWWKSFGILATCWYDEQ